MTTLAELKAQYRRQMHSRSDGAPEGPALPWGIDTKALIHDANYPLLLEFPADAHMAFIDGQWRRLADGRIRATFNSEDELLFCLAAVGRVYA